MYRNEQLDFTSAVAQSITISNSDKVCTEAEWQSTNGRCKALQYAFFVALNNNGGQTPIDTIKYNG